MSSELSASRNKFFRTLIIAPLLLVGLLFFSRVYGANFTSRNLTLSDNLASDTATYKLSFDIPASETLGSISLQFCQESPLVGDACTTPVGFDASAVTLLTQTGETGFSVLPSGTSTNTVVLTRAPAATTATTLTYELGNMRNPIATGTFYGRLQTFATSDASGSDTEHGGLALEINTPIQISATVPPYLLFCLGVTIAPYDCATASGDYVNFGNLSGTATSSATTQMLTATNAKNGYAINVYGTTMISGTNVINAMIVSDVSRPGVSQFGLNLVANTTPAVGADPIGNGTAAPLPGYDTPNMYKFVSGDPIASVGTSDGFRLYTTSYIVNIPKGQPIGVYVATLTYVCLANF